MQVDGALNTIIFPPSSHNTVQREPTRHWLTFQPVASRCTTARGRYTMPHNTKIEYDPITWNEIKSIDVYRMITMSDLCILDVAGELLCSGMLKNVSMVSIPTGDGGLSSSVVDRLLAWFDDTDSSTNVFRNVWKNKDEEFDPSQLQSYNQSRCSIIYTVCFWFNLSTEEKRTKTHKLGDD